MTEAKRKPTERQGVVWVSSLGGVWRESRITVENLRRYSENIYGAGVTHKQRTLIFGGPPEIEVLDPRGEPDPDLGQHVTTMCRAPGVRLAVAMQRAWMDTFWFGPGIFNPVWEWVGNEYRLVELRRLPADSFVMPPPSGNYRASSSLLPGIVLNDEGAIEYWQTPAEGSIEPKRLEHVFVVTDPIHTEIAGRPTVLPVVRVIGMLDFVWNAQMQKCNRTGGPLIFIRIAEPRTSQELGGAMDDVEYAQLIARNWGKNSAYTLRENMELVDPYINDNADNLETIDALNKMIIDFFSPAAFVTKEGTLIGGSSMPEKELLSAYVAGVHTWLEEQFEQLLQVYLDANGYEGYAIRIRLPDLKTDRSEIEMKQAEIGDATQSLTLDERRALLGHEPASDEKATQIRAEYAARVPASPFGNIRSGDAIERKTERKLRTAEDDLLEAVLAALEAEEAL